MCGCLRSDLRAAGPFCVFNPSDGGIQSVSDRGKAFPISATKPLDADGAVTFLREKYGLEIHGRTLKRHAKEGRIRGAFFFAGKWQFFPNRLAELIEEHGG